MAARPRSCAAPRPWGCPTMRSALVIAQAATFIGLAVLLARTEPRLAAAQALLGVVTWLVYS